MTPKPPYDHMGLWRNEKYISTNFPCLNSTCICWLIGVLLRWPARCIGTLSTSVMSNHWNIGMSIRVELACLWARLCMLMSSIEWRLSHHKHVDMMVYGLRNICFKMKCLHSRTSEPCSLVLKVRALNALALAPDSFEHLCRLPNQFLYLF